MARHLKLTIDIAYEHEDGSDITYQDCQDLIVILHHAARCFAAQGAFTADHRATVTEWSATVDPVIQAHEYSIHDIFNNS